MGIRSVTATQDETDYDSQRHAMVSRQIERRGVDDKLITAAMRQVPRHLFVPAWQRQQAYSDHAVSIGYGQTISQPYIVAYMCQMARLDSNSRILEVGTGSGYHAAIMAQIADTVHTIEIIPQLAANAKSTHTSLGYGNIVDHTGDGYYGIPHAAPFDAIVVTAATEHIPPPLLQQLAEGGRMIIPIGHPFLVQYLVLVEKEAGQIKSRELIPVRFVPFTGTRK
jgi:protein-L-isoaspartate(D-aspartate) O-methyltransferase